MATQARMKGNRGSGGERLPDFPLDYADPVPASALAIPADAAAHPRGNSRLRFFLLPAIAVVAMIGVIAGIVLATRDGADATVSADGASPANDVPTLVAMPGTPTPTREPSPTATVPPPASVTTVAGAPAEPTVAPSPTAVVPVRVRHEVLPGQSCDALRALYGFPAASLGDFSTALARISGRTPANQCAFNQSDIVCIPTPADLGALDTLVRDTACLVSGTPTAS